MFCWFAGKRVKGFAASRVKKKKEFTSGALLGIHLYSVHRPEFRPHVGGKWLVAFVKNLT